MVRAMLFFPPVVVLLGVAGAARAQSRPVTPSTYELIINGESFLVEANRTVKLQSKQEPGVSYRVALRIAPTQRLRLNSVRFDYDCLARVEDDHKRTQRTVRMRHELGLTMLITDLGQPLPEKAPDEALKILVGSVTETFRKLKAEQLTVTEPRDRKFVGTAGRGVVIRYRDEQDLGRTCHVYVLNGPDFAVSCIVEYLDEDLDNVKWVVKKTLDSFRPVR